MLISNSHINDDDEIDNALNILSYWRMIHEEPLQKALELLQKLTLQVDRKALFANRMKRLDSIIKKLKSWETMSLYRMQDIGGCRAIVSDKKTLKKVINLARKCPEFQINNNKLKIKNYILNPKEDGYRSVHIVGRFPDAEGQNRYIEIQLRTPIQHYWATAIEIVDLFTNQSLKTNQGDNDWKELFREVASQFAIMDDVRNFETLKADRKFDGFVKLQKRILGKNIYETDSKEFRALRTCCDLIEIKSY